MQIINSIKGYWKKSFKGRKKFVDKVEYYTGCMMQLFLTNRWWSISTFAIPYLAICVLVDIFKYDTIRLYWRDDIALAVMLIFTEIALKFAYRHDKLKRGREDIASIHNRR